MAELRVGISGWTYPPWRGPFYPEGLARRRELAYASRKLRSIEINGTFYSLQRPESYAWWAEQVPDDFVFSVKAPRFITHVKRLDEPLVPLANFFASGVLRLGRKLGPVLWQLPPSFRYERGKLADFLALLPRDARQAEALARKHDFRLNGRAWLKAESGGPIRHALEIRHESFRDEGFYALLREHGVALVVADTAGKWPLIEERTAEFSYARLHGDEELYVSGYTPRALDAWAEKVRSWSRGGRDVFVYFDNDVKVRAPYDAMSLAWRLGAGPEPGRAPRVRAADIPDMGSRRWPSHPPSHARRRPRRAPARGLRRA